MLLAFVRNKGIEEVRKGERRTEFGYSGTWNIVSKKGNAEINFFKRWGSKTRK